MQIHKIVALSCMLLCVSVLLGQTKFKTVPYELIKRKIQLNGSARANSGMFSKAAYRLPIEIDIPANTVELYFAFSTAKNGASLTQNLQLALQVGETLSKLMPAGQLASAGFAIGNAATSRIQIPEGTMPINAFVFDEENKNLFFSNRNNVCLAGTNVLRSSQAVVNVRNIPEGRYYLCLENIDTWNAINVQLEVVVTVAEPVESPITPQENTNKPTDANINNPALMLGKSNYLGKRGYDCYKAGYLDSCIYFSQISLSYNSVFILSKSNLGLCYLLKGDKDKAMKFYNEIIADADKMFDKAKLKSQLQFAIRELDKLLFQNVDGVLAIRTMLNQKLLTIQ